MYSSNPSIEFVKVFEKVRENDEEKKDDCICGPTECKLYADNYHDDEISLKSIDEVDVVNLSLWESILLKSKDKMRIYEHWLRDKNIQELENTPDNGPVQFLEKEIFPLLLPAMEIMLMRAEEWDALSIQKCRFNGLDFLAEILWNRNPRHPQRSRNWLELYSIPPFKLFLKSNPRPVFPKSWLWSREEGAVIIQKWVRGWLVRKRKDVQEMRSFWKAIIAETEQKAEELGITYSALLENRKLERISPCERFKNIMKI